MTFFKSLLIAAVFACLSAQSAHATAPNLPTLQLETNIAYQQGQFGALYANCGTPKEQVVIGGSLAVWRQEMFRGYMGSPAEHDALGAAFDRAADDVARDRTACQDWIKQAAATWRSIILLSQYGMPTNRRS